MAKTKLDSIRSCVSFVANSQNLFTRPDFMLDSTPLGKQFKQQANLSRENGHPSHARNQPRHVVRQP